MDGLPSLDEALAQRIRELRREQGRTLEDVADSAGLHRTSLGLVERGKRGLSVDTAARLAEALGVSLSRLIAEAEELQRSFAPGGS